VSLLGSSGGVGRVSATLLRHRMISVTAGAAAAVIVAGSAFAATSAHASSAPGHGKMVSASDSKPITGQAPAPGPLQLLSVSPAGGSRQANGGAPITLTFSSALSPGTPLPTLTPKVAGSWRVSGATVTFTPSYGYAPGTTVTLKIPGGTAGMAGAAASAGTLGASSRVTFTTGGYSTLRLQQILAQLGYLPLTWTPSGGTSDGVIPASAPVAAGSAAAPGTTASLNEQVADAYQPPDGTFAFRPGYPAQLTSQWKAGQDNILDQGAIRAFEYDHGLTMDGTAGPQVWSHLLTAAVADQVNPNGYTYALASQDSPNESLKVWHNGKLILDTPANTGIEAAPTADGTFPVYERLPFQIMKGTNPDGTKYADPVYWISYFNGGDAVHYFDRPGYGYYQSLGCVELPMTPAKFIYPYLTYGTLVTVTGPVA
jgi:peptidoglycan hydrolase-like protein with peptidoglycan-binding domain